MQSPSEMYCTSSLLGFGLELNALSRATLIVLSIDVLFFLLLARASCAAARLAAWLISWAWAV